MKRIMNRFMAFFLLAALLFSSTSSIGVFATESFDNSEFNLFAVVGEISDEFISEATEIIQNNLDDSYFSSITMTLGEATMRVDGSEETLAYPAIASEDEILLPIFDIARAIGVEDIFIDDATGDVFVVNAAGEETAVKRYFDIDTAQMDEFVVSEDGAITALR